MFSIRGGIAEPEASHKVSKCWSALVGVRHLRAHRGRAAGARAVDSRIAPSRPEREQQSASSTKTHPHHRTSHHQHGHHHHHYHHRHHHHHDNHHHGHHRHIVIMIMTIIVNVTVHQCYHPIPILFSFPILVSCLLTLHVVAARKVTACATASAQVERPTMHAPASQASNSRSKRDRSCPCSSSCWLSCGRPAGSSVWLQDRLFEIARGHSVLVFGRLLILAMPRLDSDRRLLASAELQRTHRFIAVKEAVAVDAAVSQLPCSSCSS